jgi:hypothetical protein
VLAKASSNLTDWQTGQSSLQSVLRPWYQVVASGGQMWLGVNGQELQPRGAMRQSPTGNDMSRSVTKQQLMKTADWDIVHAVVNCKLRKLEIGL